MKTFYLVASSIIFLLILILALPQIAATCTWWAPLKKSTVPALVIFQAAGLGMILGGLLVMLWKSWDESAKNSEDEDEERE